MGIKNLNKFLRDTHPNVFKTTHVSSFAYKKIAIDTSLYLFISKARNNQKWIEEFIKLIECLAKNDVHCVFVYDAFGVSHPDKERERDERRSSRDKLTARIFELEEAVKLYHNTGEVLPVLTEFETKRDIGIKNILSKKKSLNIKGIEYAIEKLKAQTFTVTKEDFELTKTLFDILSVPYINAPLEAETICAYLCKNGIVSAVLSKDSDVLAYGAPVSISDIDTRTGECKIVEHGEILEKMNFTSEQFLDFCIMCGTDYNKNIFKVGPVKAYSLIKEYKSIDNVSGYDISVLNHKRVRSLFTEFEKVELKVDYCGIPDFDRLDVFLAENNIRTVSIRNVKSSFMRDVKVEEAE
jgi:5'-3' exonuclease